MAKAKVNWGRTVVLQGGVQMRVIDLQQSNLGGTDLTLYLTGNQTTPPDPVEEMFYFVNFGNGGNSLQFNSAAPGIGNSGTVRVSSRGTIMHIAAQGLVVDTGFATLAPSGPQRVRAHVAIGRPTEVIYRPSTTDGPVNALTAVDTYIDDFVDAVQLYVEPLGALQLATVQEFAADANNAHPAPVSAVAQRADGWITKRAPAARTRMLRFTAGGQPVDFMCWTFFRLA